MRTQPHFQPLFLARPIRPVDLAPLRPSPAPHRCPLSQEGIHPLPRSLANSALQAFCAHHPRALHRPWAPTAVLRGSAVTNFHNHSLRPWLLSPVCIPQGQAEGQCTLEPMKVCLQGNSWPPICPYQTTWARAPPHFLHHSSPLLRPSLQDRNLKHKPSLKSLCPSATPHLSAPPSQQNSRKSYRLLLS